MRATDLLLTRRASLPMSLEPSDDEDWAYETLRHFTLRMAQHGVPISTRLMVSSRAYALQQLAQARLLEDTTLADAAWDLFRHFEQRRSGLVESL